MSDFLYLNLLILVLYIVKRLLSGKISQRLQYALWLLIPVYLFTCIMNVNSLPALVMANSPKLAHNLVKFELTAGYVVDCVVAMTIEFLSAKGININVSIFYIFKVLSYGIPIVLACAFLIYNVIFAVRCVSRRRFYKRDKQTGMKIYLLDYPQTPFLLVKNIYVHPDMTQDEELLNHAICHEYSHYKQGDFVWTILRFLLFSYYWFDPIVWLAVNRMRQDSELSCDERVISVLGEGSRVSYGVSLITLMKKDGKNIKHNVMSTMRGKKKQLRERVEAIAKPQKRSIITICIMVACIVGIACYAWIGSEKNLNKPKTEAVFIWDETKVHREEIAKVRLYHFIEDITYPVVDDITKDVLAGKAVVLTEPGRYIVAVTMKNNTWVGIFDCGMDETAYSKGLLPSNIIINIGGDDK